MKTWQISIEPAAAAAAETANVDVSFISEWFFSVLSDAVTVCYADFIHSALAIDSFVH